MVRLVNCIHLYICIKNITIKNDNTRNHKVSRVIKFRVVVDCSMCGYQLSEEALSNGVFIENLAREGILDVVMRHTKKLMPQTHDCLTTD